MSTFTAMVSEIANEMDRADLNTEIGTAINRAIDFYSKKSRFWFNETTATFNTVASQGSYTSTDTGISTLREIDYVKIAISSTNNYELIPITYKDLQDENVSNFTGDPTAYAYYKENFFLYPIPNAIKTITVSFVKSYATLSGSSSNDFTTNAEDLIEARACWWVYSRYVKDYDAAKMAKEEELEAFKSLMNETNRMKATGRSVPTCF